MRYRILSVILLAAVVMSGGCVDEDLQIVPEPAAPDGSGESLFRLAVDSYTVKAQVGTKSSEPSEQPEPESADEKKIHDFWLFQFNPDGSQLAAPKYYSGGTLDTLTANAFNDLTKNVPMTIYVVTNTGSSTWATGEAFNTLEKVKAQKLPNPKPIRILADSNRTDAILIPMSGQLDRITVTDKTFVVVPVTRMYAKVKIKADFRIADMTVYDVNVTGIPWYCRVGSPIGALDANGEPQAVPFPDNTTMVSRAFSSADAVTTDEKGDKWLVLYMPENIRGEIADADKADTLNIPKNALTVHIRAKYDGMEYNFKVYPGENVRNNFNIRRNRVYRVTVDVSAATDQHNPSSNCFIVKPDGKLVFEPYNRVETGGGYKFDDYLTPDEEAKKIATTEIIWQTKNCIGDNSDPDNKRVWFDLDAENPKYSKITVLTGEEGNALIGAKNSKGEIIWSWHIWVTPNEPDNLANALVYTTFRWDTKVTVKERRRGTGLFDYVFVDVEKDGVKVLADEPRIPGYAVMRCNLGALAFKGKSEKKVNYREPFCESERRTFGMLYQWGRKDPFPPATYFTEGSGYSGPYEDIYGQHNGIPPIGDPGCLPYSNDFTDTHYGNDNRTEVGKTSVVQLNNEDSSNLFYSKASSYINGDGIVYSIAHPTVYLSPQKTATDYTYNNGDWLPEGQSVPDLWGGEAEGTKKAPLGTIKSIGWRGETDIEYFKYKVPSGQTAPMVYLRDNYGTEKSIFDPCPSGWRVAPADLWLGFTETGQDPEDTGYDMEDVNWEKSESGVFGMMMYMRDFRRGPTSYFPLQGMRIKDGRFFSSGWCGNYNNATCDGYFVNALHLHQNYMGDPKFHIFDYSNWDYFVKSTASPVRCVRDSK